MLQRAASNANSWWWASNIRTKQSRWLNDNLQEMEEKVKSMIKLIEVDADSFARKAEMYYQSRPELVGLVEETYRAYKALADRYDRISGDMHKANHTLASAFPDQFAMQDDDENGSPSEFTAIDTSKHCKAPPSGLPQINLRDKCRDASSILKRHHKKVSSNITEENVQDEIDRLQKDILRLQTEKEFIKSSYERGHAKFWEIESQITGLQDEVCTLQDEFSASSIIEYDDARALIAATAITSCEESLVSLQKQHKKSSEVANIEFKRIREVRNRLQVLKGENYLPDMKEMSGKETSKTDNEMFHHKNEGLDLYSTCLQVKQHFEINSHTSVVDLTERIDELVDKVISLEVTVSSQTAIIQTLRLETDELLKHLHELEEDKANLKTDSKCVNVRLRQAEDELHRIQGLQKKVHDDEEILHTHFVEACNSLNNISEKLQSPSHKEKDGSLASKNAENLENSKKVNEENNLKDERGNTIQENEIHVKEQIEPNANSQSDVASSQTVDSLEESEVEQLDGLVSSLLNNNEFKNKDGISEWQQMLNNGPEDRHKTLLYEHTWILGNYKDAKKRLTEMEKKNKECHFEMMAQIQELNSVNAVKDQEIRALRRKLFSHNPNIAANSRKDGQMLSKEENGRSIPAITTKSDSPVAINYSEEEVKLCHLDQQHTTSPIEETFKAELDALLDENLDFWLRFSTSYHQIQKFETSFREVQADLMMLRGSNKEGRSASASPKNILKQDMSLLDKKLMEFHTELQVWLEQNESLKRELQFRFKTLCNIQEEISKASRDTESEDSKLTPYQAAKLQGELLNMQQESNKVTKELQTGLDHVKAIQFEAAKALSRLRERFDLLGLKGYQKQNFRHISTKSKVPLRTFLFGQKRKKPSFFLCMSPAPAMQHDP